MRKSIIILILAIIACAQAMAQKRDTVALEDFDAYLSKAKGEVCVAVDITHPVNWGPRPEGYGRLSEMLYCMLKHPDISVDLAIITNYTAIGGFRYCKSLVAITIPESVTWISSNAFRNLPNLRKVVMPSNLETIAYGAFCNCRSLRQITIPKSVQEIGPSAFRNCENLSQIVVENPNVIFSGKKQKDATRIHYNAFWGCKVLQDKNDPCTGIINGKRFPYVDNDTREFVLTDTLTSFKWFGIDDLPNLETITISQSTIDYDGTKSNSYTRSVNNCPKLKKITLPEGITQTPKLSDCPSLEIVTIPSTLKWIPDHGFAGCSQLKEIVLPDSIKRIGKFAFEGCESLKTINIPKSCEILRGTFWGCTTLAGEGNPKTITVDGREVPYFALDCVAKFDGYVPDNFFEDFTTMRSIKLVGNIRVIRSGAFRNCSSLKSIEWPKGLQSIGERYDYKYSPVFWGCSSLEIINFPEGLTRLVGPIFANPNNNEFYYEKFYNSIKELTLPSTLASADMLDLSELDSLQKLTIKTDKLKTIALKHEESTWEVRFDDDRTKLYQRCVYFGIPSTTHPIDIYVTPDLIPEYEKELLKILDYRATGPEIQEMARFHAIEE